jgi:hypothetical protein
MGQFPRYLYPISITDGTLFPDMLGLLLVPGACASRASQLHAGEAIGREPGERASCAKNERSSWVPKCALVEVEPWKTSRGLSCQGVDVDSDPASTCAGLCLFGGLDAAVRLPSEREAATVKRRKMLSP